jgi:hypothetical protein
VVTQVPAGGLTSLEQSLVEHVGRGEWLDLVAEDEAVDEAAMRSWGDSRTCRATVIRDILRGRLASDPDPHGLRLRGAKITGRLDLENLSTDVSLELKGCLLEEGLLARGARLASVSLADCRIEHPAEPPLHGAGLICSALDLTGAEIMGHARLGAVNLVGAHIGSDLSCTGALLSNQSGPALVVDSLQVGKDMYLNNGFTATGSGGGGAVRLVGAHVGGNLDCGGAHLRNESGPALNADGLQVDQRMFLNRDFTAAGSGLFGAVNLVGAHIGGYLVCTGELHNEFGAALLAQRLQVDQNMHLRESFAATGAGWQAAVDLKGARVGGAFVFAPERLKHEDDSHQRLIVDGLTYAGVPDEISPQGWRKLLRHGTPYYAAQPYRQLAAGYQAMGDERQARQTLMAQRDDQLARGDIRWAGRLWGRITKVTLGYGYQPWRALWFLVGVVVVSCVLAVVLGAHGALAQTDRTATHGRSCTVVQRVSVGLDLNLPVGTSVARAQCDLSTDSSSVTAFWLTAAGWVLRVLAWVFAALFIAGFTSAVRKT